MSLTPRLRSPLSFGGGRAAQADAYLVSDNVNGLHLDGLGAQVPNLWLGPIYISSLSLKYIRSQDLWQGGAKITLPGCALAIGGVDTLAVPVLGSVKLFTAYGLYEYPDYFEFGGSFSFGVSFLQLDGGVSGFVYPSNRTFNIEAGVKACLRGIEIGYKIVSVKVSPCIRSAASSPVTGSASVASSRSRSRSSGRSTSRSARATTGATIRLT